MIKGKKIYIILFAVIVINIIFDINVSNYFEILRECFNKPIPLTYNLYAVICSVFALISILIVIDILLVFKKENDKNKGVQIKTEDGTYGTSNWMNENEMADVLSTDNKPGIILGKYNNNIVKLPFESHFNKNICVFGSSGSMKTIRFCAYKFTGIIKIQ